MSSGVYSARPSRQSQQRAGSSSTGISLSCWRMICCSECCSLSREQRLGSIRNVLRGRVWRVLMVAFSVILLFGEEIRILFLPRTADIACDVVFFVTFCFFIIDIFLRILAEPNYFSLSFFCPKKRNQQNPNNNDVTDNDLSNCCCHLPSFLFWSDLLSTLTLLYDISIIGKREAQQFKILVDEGGFPVSLLFCLLLAFDIPSNRTSRSFYAPGRRRKG